MFGVFKQPERQQVIQIYNSHSQDYFDWDVSVKARAVDVRLNVHGEA